MKSPNRPLFLARDTYRRRRTMDAARILPIAGAVGFGVPLLWDQQSATWVGLAYLVIAWVVLIVAAGLISRRLIQSDPKEDDAGGTDAGL